MPLYLAPNSYNVQEADKILHDTSPRFTFGSKVNGEKPLDTPGSLKLKYFYTFLTINLNSFFSF